MKENLESLEDLSRYLEELEYEHRELDEIIDSQSVANLDELTVARIKKRRLAIKDKIQYLKSVLSPEIA